ncbi:MAG: hypothetical protein GDA51_06120 [Ekhidna sp.]|nr:hypothetical protein [Ekhidna sp.]
MVQKENMEQEDISQENISKVQKALDNKKFKYRTIRGISEETEIPLEQVQDIIHFHLEGVVRSRYRNQFEEQLFTNRKKLSKSSPFRKFGAALINRAD